MQRLNLMASHVTLCNKHLYALVQIPAGIHAAPKPALRGFMGTGSVLKQMAPVRAVPGSAIIRRYRFKTSSANWRQTLAVGWNLCPQGSSMKLLGFQSEQCLSYKTEQPKEWPGRRSFSSPPLFFLPAAQVPWLQFGHPQLAEAAVK